MSSGRTHDFCTVLLAPASAGIGFYLATKLGADVVSAAVSGAAGCLMALFVNSDLDQRSITNAETNWSKAGPLGWLVSYLWVWLWTPYAYLIPNHRSMWSHLPVLSTFLRIAYAAPILLVFSWLGALVFKVNLFDYPKIVWPAMAFSFLGLCIADTGHAVLDVLASVRTWWRLTWYRLLH